jgi:hypothetical protein
MTDYLARRYLRGSVVGQSRSSRGSPVISGTQ